MVYRDWTVRLSATSLGYVARYTSPIGQTRDVGGLFPTDQQALTYAQALVDHLIRCEWLGLGVGKEPPVGPADLDGQSLSPPRAEAAPLPSF
jgi:hypothetical protein